MIKCNAPCLWNTTTLRAVALKNVKCLLIPQLHHFLNTPKQLLPLGRRLALQIYNYEVYHDLPFTINEVQNFSTSSKWKYAATLISSSYHKLITCHSSRKPFNFVALFLELYFATKHFLFRLYKMSCTHTNHPSVVIFKTDANDDDFLIMKQSRQAFMRS